MSIEILGFEQGECDDDGKQCRGVRFQLFCDSRNQTFMCFRHFRELVEVMLRAGIIWSFPLDDVIFSLAVPPGAWAESTTQSRSAGEQVARGEGVSRTRTVGTGCKDCGRRHQTTTDSESWGETEGHTDPF